MLYKRVEFLEDGKSAEPVNFVGVHPLRWQSEFGEPTAAFAEVDDEDTEALCAAGDELAAACLHFSKVHHYDGNSEHETDARVDPQDWAEFDAALRRWREVTGTE